MALRKFLLALAICLCTLKVGSANDRDINQLPMQYADYEGNTPQKVPKIAIIGAGIAGASAAHHLHQLTRLRLPLDITVYEAKDRVGGRIKSVQVHDTSGKIVEAGAVSFSDDDWCLKEAMQEVGLKPAYKRQSNHRTGVWDGNDFLISYQDDEAPGTGSWRDSLRWFWKYGRAPSQLQSMVLVAFENFHTFAMFQSFRNLVEAIHERFLDDEVSQTAWEYFLNSRQLTAKFVNEVIRASTRHYASLDLHDVNALSALAASKSIPSISIDQGNQRLPNRMLKISEASIQLATRVHRISPGKERRWELQMLHKDTASADIIETSADFDIIILTAPFASHSIEIDPLPSLSTTKRTLPEPAERHITLFTTLKHLYPTYFNQPANFTLPENIFTAPKPGSGDAGIFSVTVVDLVSPADAGDCINELEYVYKITSSRPIQDTEIACLIGHDIPNDEEKEVELRHMGITWVHREVWPHAHPIFRSGQPLLDDIGIAPDLLYTGAGDDVLNSMEMSCRMGLNVAKHLYHSKWLGEIIP